MFKVPFLRNILLVSIFVALGFPFVETFVIHPGYYEVLLEETEGEAVRMAQYLVRAAGLNALSLASEEVKVKLDEELAFFSKDSNLVKLRLYNSQGDIVYSSRPDEVGLATMQSSFFEVVAQGQIYSSEITRGDLTTSQQKSSVDQLETCVPIVVGKTFIGALELSLDVSGSRMRIQDLASRSFVMLMFYSAGFLLIIYWVLDRAYVSVEARYQAEKALVKANQDLETSVDERTEDLNRINRLLVGEIEERTQAQLTMSRALKEAREARMKIDGILKSVLDGLLVTDREGRVVLLNGAAETLLGINASQIIGQPVESLPIDLLLKDRLMGALLDRQCGVQFDFELQGGASVYRGRTFILRQKETGDSGMIFLFCDVTRDREMDRMKNEFFSVAAHQINTPLSIITGCSELLMNPDFEDLDEDQRLEFLGNINDSAHLLAGIVEDLVDISRVEAGHRLGLDFSVFRFDQMVSEMLDRYRSSNKLHSFRLEAPSGGLEIQADATRLKQVMENLLSNAVKYAPNGGEVLVRMDLVDAFCQVSVRDQGVGMSLEQVERVFDKCYRADGPDPCASGTGLGMSIARHIIEAHQGGIRALSEPGKGSLFEFLLPLSQEDWLMDDAQGQ